MTRIAMIRLAAILASTLFGIGLADHAFAAEIDTARGLVDIRKPPQKLAVFDIAAIDTLDALGVKIAGAPENLYVPELARVKDGAESVGTIFEPDLEALSALGPDLIVIGARSAGKLEDVGRIAQTIDMTMSGDDLVQQTSARVLAYGKMLDREREAKEVAAKFDAVLQSARAAVQGKGNALVLMTNGPKITAYGKGSRFGWVHTALDLPAAVDDVEKATHGEAISFEFVRKANPDWLIVLDRAAAIGAKEQSAKATLDNELVADTTAWKNGHIIYLPASDFYIAAGGVQSTTRVLETIRAAFEAAK